MTELARLACLLLGAVLLTTLAPAPAEAVPFRRPYENAIRLGYGFDNNPAAAGCTDYACGGRCYRGHTGSDFPLPHGTPVLAGAAGTVSAVNQGCANTGHLGNPCGGRCGNYVRLSHPGGHSTIYCHMQNGSVAVRVGQAVGCGQMLGRSASSGSSTGPHLHFGWNPPGSAARDPFGGRCSGHGGVWVDQGNGTPSPNCPNACQCNPGATQREGCGNCGTRSRGCGADCRWGGWSGCDGQGECAAGATQARDCCDCGRQSRGCGGDCRWGGWSACAVADPPGPPPCDTGELGVCADGAIQCVEGCRTCVQTVFPSPEVCDDLDNDCDGVVDNDAVEMGDPPARHAAALVDLSAPGALRPGERAYVWAQFRNVGREAWPTDALWLDAQGAEGGPSALRDPEGWAAHDVAAVHREAVGPGESIRLQFPVRMPTEPMASGSHLSLSLDGVPIACPSPGFGLEPVRLASAATPLGGAPAEDAGAWGELDVGVGAMEGGESPDSGPHTGLPPGAAPPGDEASSLSGGCGAVPGRAPGWPAWAALALALVGIRRRGT